MNLWMAPNVFPQKAFWHKWVRESLLDTSGFGSVLCLLSYLTTRLALSMRRRRVVGISSRRKLKKFALHKKTSLSWHKLEPRPKSQSVKEAAVIVVVVSSSTILSASQMRANKKTVQRINVKVFQLACCLAQSFFLFCCDTITLLCPYSRGCEYQVEHKPKFKKLHS